MLSVPKKFTIVWARTKFAVVKLSDAFLFLGAPGEHASRKLKHIKNAGPTTSTYLYLSTSTNLPNLPTFTYLNQPTQPNYLYLRKTNRVLLHPAVGVIPLPLPGPKGLSLRRRRRDPTLPCPAPGTYPAVGVALTRLLSRPAVRGLSAVGVVVTRPHPPLRFQGLISPSALASLWPDPIPQSASASL